MSNIPHRRTHPYEKLPLFCDVMEKSNFSKTTTCDTFNVASKTEKSINLNSHTHFTVHYRLGLIKFEKFQTVIDFGMSDENYKEFQLIRK